MQVLHDYIKQCYKIAKGVKILEFISVCAQGIIVSVIIAFYVSDPAGMLTKFIPGYVKPKIFEFMLSFIIIGSSVIVSFIASFFFGKPSEEKIKGLTYSTTIKNQK